MHFLEEPEQALKREISEELNANLVNYKFINTISNIFQVNCINAHEMMHLYYCEIDKAIEDGQLMTADIYTNELVWLSIDQIKSLRHKIVPATITSYILGEHNNES